VPSPFLWLRQQAASRSAQPEQWGDEVPSPTFDPPDEIIKDLAGHAWSQLETAIQASAKENDTLVVWIVDRTASMSARRLELADRITKTFGDQPSGSQHKLQHSIISFARGGGASRRQPTTTANDAATQIREIADDYYGDEFVMGAVNSISFRLMTGWKQAFSDWNCIAVVATDERGDDFNMAEDVARQCVKMNVRVFCLGNASPFGTEKGYVRYKYADGFQVDVPVNLGPETIEFQTVVAPTLMAPTIEPTQVSSSFGPYGLELLCRKTGGEFLIYEDKAPHRFSRNLMTEYVPDYTSRSEFEKAIRENRARMALTEAAVLSRSYSRIRSKLRFRADSHNALRVSLTECQKACAVVSQRTVKLISLLERGSSVRERLQGKRWQASYDLAMGQATAVQARILALNIRMATMKVKPINCEIPGNNTWVIEPARGTDTDIPFVAKIVAKSNRFLARVVREHPGTPFAFIAKCELERGVCWKWRESKSMWKDVRKMSPILINPIHQPKRKFTPRRRNVEL